MINSTEE